MPPGSGSRQLRPSVNVLTLRRWRGGRRGLGRSASSGSLCSPWERSPASSRILIGCGLRTERAFVALPLPLGLLIVAISLTVGLVCHPRLTPSGTPTSHAVTQSTPVEAAPSITLPPDPPPPAAPAPAPPVLVRTPPPVEVPTPCPVHPAAAAARCRRDQPRCPRPHQTDHAAPSVLRRVGFTRRPRHRAGARPNRGLKLTVGQLERASMLLTERIEADAIEPEGALGGARPHLADERRRRRADRSTRRVANRNRNVRHAAAGVVARHRRSSSHRRRSPPAPYRDRTRLNGRTATRRRWASISPTPSVAPTACGTGCAASRTATSSPRTFAATEIPFLLESVDPSPAPTASS